MCHKFAICAVFGGLGTVGFYVGSLLIVVPILTFGIGLCCSQYDIDQNAHATSLQSWAIGLEHLSVGAQRKMD